MPVSFNHIRKCPDIYHRLYKDERILEVTRIWLCFRKIHLATLIKLYQYVLLHLITFAEDINRTIPRYLTHIQLDIPITKLRSIKADITEWMMSIRYLEVISV